MINNIETFLTYENIINTLKSLNVNDLDYLGIKLLSMPIESATIERRIGINYDAVSILNLSI